MNDKEILDLYFSRDERAISETMNSFGAGLTRFALKFLSDRRDAEECVNDAYKAVWDTIPPNRPDNLFAYLAALCRNSALDKVKKNTAQKRSVTIVELTNEMSECVPDQGSISDERADRLSVLINEYLDTLSKDKRAVFVGRYWYCESVAEISKRTGFSESKVKTTLHRTREGLKKYIIKKGESL